MDQTKKFAVATKAVVHNPEGKYLILKKSSLEDINPNTYDLPGGRIEFGEKLDQAVIREVKEETGLNVAPQQIFNAWTFTKDDNFQLTGIDFLCKLIDGEESISPEHDELVWLSLEEVEENPDFPQWLIETIRKADSLKISLNLK